MKTIKQYLNEITSSDYALVFFVACMFLAIFIILMVVI